MDSNSSGERTFGFGFGSIWRVASFLSVSAAGAYPISFCSFFRFEAIMATLATAPTTGKTISKGSFHFDEVVPAGSFGDVEFED